MKISKERLKQLVQEELAISVGTVGNVGPGMMGGDEPHIESDGEGYMAKQNLWKIAEYAGKLYEMLDDNDNLEAWVEEKIAIAAFLMDSVGHYIEYAKHREHEAAEGDVDTLEAGEEFEAPGEEEEEYEFEPEDEFGGRERGERDRDDEYDDDDEEYDDEEYDDDEGEEEGR